MASDRAEWQGTGRRGGRLGNLIGALRVVRAAAVRSRAVARRLLATDGVDYSQLWATSSDDSRSLVEQFATIQHYVGGDRDSFLKALAVARSFAGSEPGSASRAGLLLDVLEANQLIRENQIAAAVGRYRRRIRQEARSLGAMGLRQRAGAPRALCQQREVLGVLEVNLADLLSRNPLDVSETEEHYQCACAYLPDNPFVKGRLADFYLSRKRWEQAAEQFKGAFTAGEGIDRDSRELNANLAHVYREWARDLNRPVEPAGGAPRGLAIGQAPATGGEAALGRLEQALASLDWAGIGAWKGAIHFDRASILEALDRRQEASEEYVASANCYQEAADFDSRTVAQMRATDLLVGKTPLHEARDGYEAILRVAASIKDVNVKREREDSLSARLAIVEIARDQSSTRHADLVARWKRESHFGDATWGPYYDTLAKAEPLLKHATLRDPVIVFYSQLLRHTTDLVDQRDLTAAVLKLYEWERNDVDAHEEHDQELGGSATAPGLLNVVAPLAVEFGEELADGVVLDDSKVMECVSPMRNSINERFGVRIPGVRVRASPDLRHGEYLLRIHEVHAIRGTYRDGQFRQAFRHLEDVIASNLVEFVGHQEVQNYLERNLLVRPTAEDVSEKENCRHMDPLTSVLRALVAERVPLLGSWRFSRGDIKGLASLAGKLGRRSDAVSDFLGGHLSTATQQALAGRDVDASTDGRLLGALVDDLNGVVETCTVYDEERFRGVTLRPETLQILGQAESVRDSRLFNRLLLEDAYPNELSRGPWAYAGKLYQTFRRGWAGRLPLSEIVEDIRRVSEVRDRLWGNDGCHALVLLSQAFEAWMGSRVQPCGDFQVLTSGAKQQREILDALVDGVRSYRQPGLVVRRQDLRALWRQLIAVRLPEVPVLSVQELRVSASAVSPLPETAVPEE